MCREPRNVSVATGSIKMENRSTRSVLPRGNPIRFVLERGLFHRFNKLYTHTLTRKGHFFVCKEKVVQLRKFRCAAVEEDLQQLFKSPQHILSPSAAHVHFSQLSHQTDQLAHFSGWSCLTVSSLSHRSLETGPTLITSYLVSQFVW